ncbi:hypothetical protein FOZ63_032934, partial [Perkinsus olseni]
MDYVVSKQRGRWNAVESITAASWAGSAALGGWLCDGHDYRYAFGITAHIYTVSLLMRIPLFFLVKEKIEDHDHDLQTALIEDGNKTHLQDILPTRGLGFVTRYRISCDLQAAAATVLFVYLRSWLLLHRQQKHGSRIAGVDIRDVLLGFGDADWLANRPLQSCEAAEDRLTGVNSDTCDVHSSASYSLFADSLPYGQRADAMSTVSILQNVAG